MDDRLLEFSLSLRPEDRLEQAHAGYLLYHDVHRPYERPWVKAISSLEEYLRFSEENDLFR